MWKRSLVMSASVLLSLFFHPLFEAPASGEEPPAVIFILDASGSMWGRLGEQAKIDVARKVMGKVLGELPEGVKVGLMVYGHRRKADCQDIELIHAPQAAGGKKTAEAITRLVPKGKTPLAAALTQAGDYWRQQQGEATVVLVSDGLETCGGDPCKVAKTLREQGIKVTIHVVGFDVSGPDVEQLQCIARAGGGQYFQADTGEGLARALTAVSDHIVTGTALPEPPPQPKVQAAKAQTKRIKVAGPGTVVLAPAPWVAMPPYYWLLADAETGAEAARSTSGTLRVKPGVYQIVWRQVEHGAGNVNLSEVVTVKAGEESVVPLTTGVRLTVPEGIGPPYAWRLVDDGGATVAAFGGSLDPQLVPAGSYHLIWRQTEHGHPNVDLGQVVVESGKLTEMVLDHGIVVTLPDWLQPPHSYSLLPEGGSQITLSQPGTQVVPAGTYKLTWKQSEHGFSEIQWGTIQVPTKGFADIAIDSGLTFLAGNAPAPYRIYVEDKSTGAWAEMADSWGPMPLPPGVYKVDMQDKEHGGSRVTLIEELPIGKGQLIELEL